MAIYSLHHQPIGKSTQARPHTSAAHVRYITRPSAASRIEASRMPDNPSAAQAFMVDAENSDRKNARVVDKILLALPRELDAEQRADLVRGYANEVTQGRAPWLVAFHDQGKDAHNPHAHLVIRDRDPETRKRVAGLSEKGSTERLRSMWEDHANRALERAGQGARIDRRTLQAQGIEREPTVHEGPRAQQMERRGARPESRLRHYRNRPGSRQPHRQVDYREIDHGRSRPAYNRDVRETPVDYWQAVDASNQLQELAALRAIHHPPILVDVQGSFCPLPQLADKFVRFSAERLGFNPDLLPFGRTLRAPGLSSGLSLVPTTDHPGADQGQPQKERPNVVLGEQGNPEGNLRFHTSNISINASNEKGDGMEDIEKLLGKHKEDRLTAEFEYNKAKSLLDSTMERAFYDPKASMKKMDQYARQKNSREALYEKLKDKNQVFGRRPGSILSKDGFKWGSEAKRRDADIARHNLPIILREADTKREAWQNAQRAERDALNRYGPKTGAAGGPTKGPAATSGKSQASGATGGPAGGLGSGPSSTPGAAYGPGPAPGPSSYPKEAVRPEDKRDRAHQPASTAKTPEREDDKRNAQAQRQMQEKLAREQHPAFARSEQEPRQQAAMTPEAIQERRVAAEARERAVREKNPAFGRSESQPELAPGKGSFSDKINQSGPAPQRTGSFSDKLAELKRNPQPEKDRGRPERTRGDEFER